MAGAASEYPHLFLNINRISEKKVIVENSLKRLVEKLNILNPDYYFLIEDDYIPISKDFYEPFLNLMTDTNVFVCCYKNYIWQNPTRQHPAISNGLLKNEACKNVFNKHGLLFQYFGLSFGDACWAQEEFFSYFEEFNYEFCDILENYNMPFHNAIDDNYISYGKPEGEILINSILKDLV